MTTASARPTASPWNIWFMGGTCPRSSSAPVRSSGTSSYQTPGPAANEKLISGPVPNLSPGSSPVYSLVDSQSKYLYIANQSSNNSTLPNSSISAFNIQIAPYQPIPDGTNNPYTVGAGPVCMVEDPSNQYIYTSNGDGTITGKLLDKSTGKLSDLTRGSTFAAVGQATCLAVSGNVD